MGKHYKSSHKTNDKVEENSGNSDHTQRVISLERIPGKSLKGPTIQ